MPLIKTAYEQFDDGRIGLREIVAGSGGHARPGMLCFPYAGGQSLVFRSVAEYLGSARASHVGPIHAVDPPGHGWATGQALDDIEALADLYERQLPSRLFESAILFGHSMGGYVVMALAHRLARLERPPAALIISATRPPHRRAEFARLSDLADDRLVDEVNRIGDAPSPLVAHYRAIIRTDFRACESWSAPVEPSPMRALILGGAHDQYCPPHHIIEWDRYFPNSEFNWIDGGHLFLESHARETGRAISAFAAKIGRE
jgi:surfactin synthase thioesterase subunit